MTSPVAPGAPVRLRDVVAGYGWGPFRRAVLRGVDLSFRPGAVTAVIGPNGAGKTTLFRVLLGFLRPATGTVSLWGVPPRVFRRRHGIGFLPEATPVPGGWTALDLFEEACDLQGMTRHERARALQAARERTGLEEPRLRSPLSRLSKGLARRVLLAYALLGEPRLVLLDEPLSGLDPEARAHLRSVVAHAARAGATLLLSSHELGEVARMADSAAVLTEGRVSRLVEHPATADILEDAVRESPGSTTGRSAGRPSPSARNGTEGP